MALSGTISGSTNNEYIQARIRWSASQSVANNTSSVTAIFEARKLSTSSAGTSGNGTWYLTINGTKKTITKSMSLPANNSWYEIGRNTVSVTHKANGSKSISIVGSGGTVTTSWTKTTCSSTVTLNTIPRQTTPTFDSKTKNFGAVLKITVSPASSSFTHTLQYKWNGVTTTITSGYSSGTYSWTIPLSLMNDLTTATSSSGLVIICKTYYSGSLLGTVNTAITCNVPANIIPSVDSITLSDSGTTIPATWDVFVKSLSTLHVVSTASGTYGSTIKSYTVEALEQKVAGSDVDVGVINQSGEISVKVTVTDSRGRAASSTVTAQVVDYEPPVIESCVIERTNNQGIPVENGTFLRATLGCSISSVEGHNEMTARIYYKDASDPNVQRTLAREIHEDGVIYIQGGVYMIPGMDIAKTYTVDVEVQDILTPEPTKIVGAIASEGAIISWRHGGTGVAFGKTSEDPFVADFQWTIRGRNGAQFDTPLPITSGGTGADSLQGFISTLLDYIYPVGCLYWSKDSTDPGTLFGGTWTPIQDTFVLATGSTYAANSSGGAATHRHLAPIGSNGSAVGGVNINGTTSSGSGKTYRTADQDYTGTLSSNVTMWYTAAGSSLPPYITRYCWERTA